MTTRTDDYPYIFSKEREEKILAEMETTKEEMMATQGIRKLSKAKQQEFTTKFCQWIEKMGGDRTSTDLDRSEYTIDSIFGKLRVFLGYTSVEMYGYEAYGKFLEPVEAGKADPLFINACSGKWNHYISDVDMPVDEAIAQMISWIEQVLTKEQDND